MFETIRALIENLPKIILEAAKSILGIIALMVLTLSVVSLILFNQASDNTKTLIYVITIISFLLFVGAVIKVTQLEEPKRSNIGNVQSLSAENNSLLHISIVVHDASDKTKGVAGATVTISLPPEPQEKTTDAKGNTIFFFPSGLNGQKVRINAQKEGYEIRKSKIVTLTNETQYFLSLAKENEPLAEANNSISPTSTESMLASKDSKSLLPKFSYFIYISDSKIEMLEEQILWQEKDVTEVHKRFDSLASVLANLQEQDQIGDINSNKSFIYGEYLMKWGVIDWGVIAEDIRVSFFFSAKTNPILLMAGSVHHLIGEKVKDYAFPKGSFGHSGSHLPSIMRAIRLSTQGHGSWSNMIGKGFDYIYDYIFSLEFVHENFSHFSSRYDDEIEMPANFPEQKLVFVARVLQRLPIPSDEEIKKFLEKATTKEKQEIEELVKDAKDVLICTPVYVALA